MTNFQILSDIFLTEFCNWHISVSFLTVFCQFSDTFLQLTVFWQLYDRYMTDLWKFWDLHCLWVPKFIFIGLLPTETPFGEMVSNIQLMPICQYYAGKGTKATLTKAASTASAMASDKKASVLDPKLYDCDHLFAGVDFTKDTKQTTWYGCSINHGWGRNFWKYLQ